MPRRYLIRRRKTPKTTDGHLRSTSNCTCTPATCNLSTGCDSIVSKNSHNINHSRLTAHYIALPPGVSLRQIYADFLGYLLKHSKSFFEDRILDGKQIWARYQPKMEVVIAHPNGWGIREQTFLRGAAIDAGFSDVASASTKIRFVTEAEASVHFCIYHTNLGERLKVYREVYAVKT